MHLFSNTGKFIFSFIDLFYVIFRRLTLLVGWSFIDSTCERHLHYVRHLVLLVILFCFDVIWAIKLDVGSPFGGLQLC
jgi:hypothetical protein